MKNIIILALVSILFSFNSFGHSNRSNERQEVSSEIAKKYLGNWELASINDQTDDYKISLNLTKEEARIAGSTGCNSFGGEVVVVGKQLTVKRVFSTKKMCQPELMKKEQRILKAIKGQFSIDIDRNQLILYNEQTTLVFQQTEQKK